MLYILIPADILLLPVLFKIINKLVSKSIISIIVIIIIKINNNNNSNNSNNILIINSTPLKKIRFK